MRRKFRSGHLEIVSVSGDEEGLGLSNPDSSFPEQPQQSDEAHREQELQTSQSLLDCLELLDSESLQAILTEGLSVLLARQQKQMGDSLDDPRRGLNFVVESSGNPHYFFVMSSVR